MILHEAGTQRLVEADALDVLVAVFKKLIGAVLNAGGEGGVGRAAVRGIVLEAAVLRRIVGRRDDDAVRRGGGLPVPAEDGVGDGGSGGVAVAGLDHGDHAVGGEHFQRGAPGGFGKGVGVFAEEERTGDAFGLAHVAHGLRDREDVGFVEAGAQGGAAMPGRTEAYGLFGNVGGRFIGVVGGNESGNVGELVGAGQLARLRIKSHGESPENGRGDRMLCPQPTRKGGAC